MPKTPKQIVILGTGRSFTSVTSCMIGQHPDMIGLPETNIYSDPTLGEVYDRFSERGTTRRRAGLLRTLAHFNDGEQTEASIDEAECFWLENEHWTSRQFADHLSKLIAPRGIVEKSISTCRDPSTLARVREAWPDAYYLHITRQPENIVKSMQSRVTGALEKGNGRRRQEMLKVHSLGEYYNRVTIRILKFMVTLPPGQGMNLNGEDFLTDARFYCRQICEWTGLDASDTAIEAMLHPENNPFAHHGPPKAPGGMSRTFLDNPTYSGKPVKVEPMSIDPSDPAVPEDRRVMALLGHRLGYI